MHDLLEAGPPSGHLSMQAAWSARARMRAGQQAHSAWQDERAAIDDSFRREVTIKHTVVVDEWECTVQGRVDGLSHEGEHVVVEEVKSTALPGDRLAALTLDDVPGYVRQLQLYLWFLAAEGHDPIGRLVLIGLADGFRRVLHVPFDAALGAWLRSQLGWIVGERQRRLAWLHQRRGAAVPFAHDAFRPGQQHLAEEVEQALHSNRHLLLSAPTGYGKTAAVLHAAIKVAWATDRRIFFATARTTQQRMAEEALLAMAERGLPLRAVSIRAREKLCLNEVVACRPDACRFARGYHDKVREGALTERAWHGHPRLTPDEVLTIAEPAEACPFALTLDLVRGADVVVGDYNYVFDPAVRLAELTDTPGEWIVVADEAHNLPERAMGYSSPTIELSLVEQALHALDTDPRYAAIADVAERIAGWLRQGADVAWELGQQDRVSGWREVSLPLADALSRRELAQLAEDVDAVALDYVLLKHERPLFLAGEVDPWLESARGILRLRSALDRAGEETVAIWRARRATRRSARRPRAAQLTMLGPAEDHGPPDVEVALSLLCRDPSGLLSPLLLSLAGSVQMSATLAPSDFFQQMSGLPFDKTVVADFPSPFPPEHRRVLVLPQVSTEYKHRGRDRHATATLVGDVVRAVPGNVAVFCSSFALRDDLLPHLDLGERPVLMQERRMDEAARQGLLDTLQRAEGHVLLGVLGGIFAEGVDLPGDALLAAVIVGPSLPMANLERRLLQQWFQERYQEGFRYAWLVPGMARVVQAAGRVVRTPQDRGAVVLIGQRFLRSQYQDFFPRDWTPIRSKDPVADLAGLWDGDGR
ncbi:MAG: ATP-dependent DNA helicase [Alphaproteobacteria bacterium]|nr:ATP-dependent DNA helicase [Alphaproteobacteria bacterium]